MSPQLYQIAYSPESLAQIEPGYQVLDNLSNERPDWFEYWPIRRFLLTHPLNEDTLYGFFSPKFGPKTGLPYPVVQQFIEQHQAHTDVFLFSPQPDMGAFFLNPFEQGETFDTGFIGACETVLAQLGVQLPLRHLVMDSRTTVFSNYFVARPAFWREWLGLNEALFAMAEDPQHPLHPLLTHPTSYPGSAQRKVFIMERMASLLLLNRTRWRTRAANPFTMGWSMTRFREYPREAVISDALKIAHNENGFPEYLQAFAALRNQFIGNGPAPLAEVTP